MQFRFESQSTSLGTVENYKARVGGTSPIKSSPNSALNFLVQQYHTHSISSIVCGCGIAPRGSKADRWTPAARQDAARKLPFGCWFTSSGSVISLRQSGHVLCSFSHVVMHFRETNGCKVLW